jgi:hypothetical protein
MWLDKIREMTTHASFAAAANVPQLDSLEKALNVALPSELRTLLLESDGVRGEYSIDLVWPTQRIATDNSLFRSEPNFRELYMPFDHLLFFADAGNGDQFAFPILSGGVSHDVFAWNHENDSRTWVAPSLGKYFEWWLSGRIKL